MEDRPVLVIDDKDPTAIAERLENRGLQATVASDGSRAIGNTESCCVVYGHLAGHTVAELVSRLNDQSRSVIYLYDDERSATIALDAGAAATIPRRDPDTDWSGHLAATVDSVRRRAPTRQDNKLMLSNALDELIDIFFILRVNGEFIRWNDKLSETTGYSDEEISEMQPVDLFDGEDARRIENAIGRVVLNGHVTEVASLTTKDGRQIPHEFTGALIDADEGQAIVGTGRDISQRRERKRELTRQTEQLEAANHVNDLIRDVMAELLAAKTREEISQRVCETLTADDTYRFAWVGSYDDETGRIEPNAWAGEGEGYLDHRPTGESGTGETITALTAVRERRVVFAQDVADAPEAAPWRDSALEHGLRSAAAIPIVYGDATFGCLCLYADRPNAFGSLERAVLAELGEILGHAINAAEAWRALTADTVTELQFQIEDEASFLVRAAEDMDAELELVGSTTQPDGSIVQLFTVTGVEPELVRQFADVAPMEAEVVTERSDESIVKVTIEAYSVSHVLTEFGGAVRAIKVTDGEVRVRADVPRDTNVEAVLAKIREVYDSTLLSQRTVDREERTDVDFRADTERHLTERQLNVLETAFRAGFFEWPRDQSGKEVAELLDVAPPTFHQHLRVGQRKLLEVLFDEGPPQHHNGTATSVDEIDLSEIEDQ
jgi:PAS domain S-box-containing protein